LGVNICSHLSLLEPAVIRNCTTAMLTRQVSAIGRNLRDYDCLWPPEVVLNST
jgi:hypothetical protein